MRHPLASIGLFAGLRPHELDRIASTVDRAHFDPGSIIVREGSRRFDVYIVVSGMAVVTTGSAIVGTIGPGEVVGELAALDRGERTATVTAASHLEALVIPQHAFRTLFDELPLLRVAILKQVASRFRDLLDEQR